MTAPTRKLKGEPFSYSFVLIHLIMWYSGTSLTSQLKEKQREFDTMFEKNFNLENKVWICSEICYFTKLQTILS